MKKVILTLVSAVAMTTAYAQGGTNSPFSMYGLGALADQSTGFNRGMNGVGIAFKEHNQVNYMNPASYANIDSLTFIFDAGLSLQVANMAEGGKKKNSKTADIEYAVGAFRIRKDLGLGFGILPFSNVGYNFQTSTPLDNYKPNSQYDKYSNTTTYNGTGGVHQVFLGLGYSPMKNLAVGVNMSYLWGTIDRSVANNLTENSAKSSSLIYGATVSNYRLDIGAQYTYQLNNKDNVTLGVTYTPGHKIANSASLMEITTNNATSVVDTLTFDAKDALDLPTILGVGLAYCRGDNWKFGLDYTLQKWSSARYPVRQNGKYETVTGMYTDMHKLNVGAEYCKNPYDRAFFPRIRYRAGVSYSTPYLKINNMDGPTEIAASAGLSIPIVNSWNNRSMLNISFQAARINMKNVMREHVFRVNVGLTFNERWFAKWKFE